jgi:myo-inositol-1(or 4)-monophosphatase
MAAGQLSQDELDEIYAFAVDLGRKAGDLLMERVEQRIAGGDSPQTFEEKENAVDIVTQTDEGKPAMQRDLMYQNQPGLT